jgi:hypothetical protein
MAWPLDLLLSLVAPLLGWIGSLPLRRWASSRGVALGAELAMAGGLVGGLAVVQALGMALGFAGLLRPVFIAPALLVAALIALALGRGEARRSFEGAAALVPSLVVLAPYLLIACFPPWDRDEMVYHLALPRAFALAGGYTRPDDNLFASLPLGWESIQAVLHALGPRPGEPPFNPRLLGAWTAWGGALATGALAREAGARRLSWVAGVLLLLVPTFLEFGSSAYVEPYLLLCTALALVAALRAARGEPGGLLAAVVLAGLATSIKYTGLTVAALLALGLALSGDPAGRARRAALFVAGCALVGSPFYLRNLLQRGNPFFPMAYGIFGGEGWDELRAAAYWETLRMYGAGQDTLDALSAPLRLFFTRNHLAGFEGSIGPLPLLLALAAACFPSGNPSPGAPSSGAPASGAPASGAPSSGDPSPGDPSSGERGATRPLLLFAALFTLFWAATVVQARFYLVALPALLAVGVGWIEARAPRLVPVALLLSAIGGASSAVFLWQRQPTAAWLRGALTRDQALTRVLPQSYPPSRALGELVPPGARVWLLWMRGYTYHVDVPYKLDSVYEEWRFANLLDRSVDGAQFVRQLRAEGVSFLLVNEQFFLRAGSSDTRPGRTDELRGRFEALVRGGTLLEVRRWNRVVLYRLADGG